MTSGLLGKPFENFIWGGCGYMGSLIGVSLLGGIGGGGGVRYNIYPLPLHHTAIYCSAVKKECDPSKCSNIYECGPFKLCYCLTHFAHLFLTIRITSI